MQQGDSIGIFNLLSIRRSSDLTSTFSEGFSFIGQSPASGNTLVLHRGPPAHRWAAWYPLGQHPRERWRWASTPASPPLAAGFCFSQADPTYPSFCTFPPMLDLVLLFASCENCAGFSLFGLWHRDLSFCLSLFFFFSWCPVCKFNTTVFQGRSDPLI